MNIRMILAGASVCLIGAAAVACGDSTSTGGAGGGTGGTASTTSGTTSTGSTAPDCTTLCKTYGAAVPQVAKDITTTAASDAKFKDDFAPLVAKGDTAVTSFENNLTAFISDAYGCTSGTYKGPGMVQAHANTPITSAHYDDFVALIAGVLEKDGVPDDYVSACFAPGLTADSLKSTIVNK